ncbi:hypothetical protein N7517_000497 [Penicillium concentricum]|uniref:Fido domain-containing protein n=1 Tax=Penicillium concentricum TaxID=293559 RepID=A0A9W9VKD6_9EURO|nr:uncharacterized protein N7517_000497 [Penicillium concentricum]KAJ5382586.1 hypothetical protein N7517_000497 [Penicillium concentricum]
MTSPNKHKRASLFEVFEGLPIETPISASQKKHPSTKINLAKNLRKYMQSTLHIGHGTITPQSINGKKAQFTVSMDDAYHYKIGCNDFDPDTIFPEIILLSNQLAGILDKKLTAGQEAAFEDHILHCLASMVYGSNVIERAGNGLNITLKLCIAIFRGDDLPDDIGETDEEFLELKKKLLRENLPSNTSAVLRSRYEIIQHAKAAHYIIGQLCNNDQDLSEEIILQTHKILTYQINTAGTPWQEYSGMYRKEEVSAGFHQFPHHSVVPSKMKAMICELESDLKQALSKSTIDPVAIASKYTHIFVNIHPFLDGNGRMCRMILNAMLLKLGGFLVCIGTNHEDCSLYMEVVCNGSALEDTYGDLDEEEKPIMHRELGSYVMSHVKNSMRKLM